MIYYYKIEDEGKLKMIGTQSFPAAEGQIGITEEEYHQLMAQIKAHAESVRNYAAQLVDGDISYSEIPEDCRVEAGDAAAPQFAEKVIKKEITIDDVPAELKEQVQTIIDSQPKNPYGISDELCETIKQDTVNEIIEGVSENGQQTAAAGE